ncbi:plant/protein [Tasmannia lanceolata]|uniref:plant/protein n=1 Tax=Tasmannia lanceolata TaxID=3420 RepID=UPI004064A5A5
MSLALIQSYSSAEEEEEERFSDEESLSSGDEGGKHFSEDNSFFDVIPKSSVNSLLPSAFDAFSEVAGPPEFLNNSVTAEKSSPVEFDRRWRHGGRKHRKEKKDLPAGVVMEAKAQLVGIRDRVRSDVEGNLPNSSAMPPPKSSISIITGESKRVASATIPEPKDAAELLRMCLQCGVPKTYSSARGMVCPICGDRPPVDPNKEAEKKKGSTIKDKEKSKRMKGQSSHASWKSETEMQLRQQFD